MTTEKHLPRYVIRRVSADIQKKIFVWIENTYLEVLIKSTYIKVMCKCLLRDKS